MNEIFTWKDTLWQCSMEGGRLIHPEQPWQWYDRHLVHVDGSLNAMQLLIDRKTNEIHHWDGNTYKPTIACGTVRSVDAFGYGWFEANIRLPKGKDLWPSFWLVGQGSWPKNGEIDIMEAYTNNKGSYKRFPLRWDVTTNVHYESDGKHKQVGARKISRIEFADPAEKIHHYELFWSEEEIVFFVNGECVRQMPRRIVEQLRGTRQYVVFDLWTRNANATIRQAMGVFDFRYTELY